MEKNFINIEDYYTEKNEREGMWHEPVFEGNGCGLEFLLIGIHSEEAIQKMTEYDKKSEEIQNSKLSDEEKKEKLDELDAERVAVLTKGIRAKDGSELMRDGKPFVFTMEAARELYRNSPDIKLDCVDFVLKSSNFMKIKA